jgi:hypothetical protein
MSTIRSFRTGKPRIGSTVAFVEQAVVRVGLDRELVPPRLLAAQLRVVAPDLEREGDLAGRAHLLAVGALEDLAEAHQYFRSIGT